MMNWKPLNPKYKPFDVENLQHYKKKESIYKECDMINEAASELCRSLELTNEKVATLAARKYLIKKGYSIIRIS